MWRNVAGLACDVLLRWPVLVASDRVRALSCRILGHTPLVSVHGGGTWQGIALGPCPHCGRPLAQVG